MPLSTIPRISIHSPHARGDAELDAERKRFKDFNPLPSCEGRPLFRKPSFRAVAFQSTPLMRGETKVAYTDALTLEISIHSPHARGDACPESRSAKDTDFNPLPSCEGRLSKSSLSSARSISIHSPHARGDFSGQFLFPPDRFQSTPLMRGETA